jgi:hypothetical protein
MTSPVAFTAVESPSSVELVRKKYLTLTKLFLMVTILFLLWVVVVGLGIGILKLGPSWAVLSLETWIYIWCALIAVFIVCELLFYALYSSKARMVPEEPPAEAEYLHGKRVYVFTFPPGVQGGIFSKTYITIDQQTVLRLRTLMVPPGEAWRKTNNEL